MKNLIVPTLQIIYFQASVEVISLIVTKLASYAMSASKSVKILFLTSRRMHWYQFHRNRVKTRSGPPKVANLLQICLLHITYNPKCWFISFPFLIDDQSTTRRRKHFLPRYKMAPFIPQSELYIEIVHKRYLLRIILTVLWLTYSDLNQIWFQ